MGPALGNYLDICPYSLLKLSGVLTLFRRWSKLGVAIALVLLALSRVVAPAWAMPSQGPDGFMVVMCSTAGDVSTSLEASAPTPVPPPHPDCAEHCLSVGGLGLAPPPAHTFDFLAAADGSTAIFPESRRLSVGSSPRSQTARAPPVIN